MFITGFCSEIQMEGGIAQALQQLLGEIVALHFWENGSDDL